MTRAVQAYLQRWSLWPPISLDLQLFMAALAVGGWTFLANVATVAKELVVAYQFGRGDELDAFLIAFLLPSFAISVLAWAFPPAAIPVYIEVEHREGQEAAHRLYASILAAIVGFFLITTALLALLAPYLLEVLGSGFHDKKLALTRRLFFLLLPVLAMKGVATIWTAVLNAQRRFSLAALTTAITPLFTVAMLFHLGSQWGIYALVVGTVGGASLELGVLAWYLRWLRIPMMPEWHGWTPAAADVARQYGPVAAGSVLMSSTLVVDQAMAAMLEPGSVSALSYGGKVVSFMVAVGATALGTAVLPHFSRMVVHGDWPGLRRTLRTSVRFVLLTTIPLTLVALYLSEPLVRLLFQRGAFTMADTQTVTTVQALLLLQLPFYLVGIVMVRLISSLKANSVLMWGCAINFVVNVVLNYVLMQWLQVAGIALSTALVYMLSVAYVGVMLSRVLAKREREHVNGTSPAVMITKAVE